MCENDDMGAADISACPLEENGKDPDATVVVVDDDDDDYDDDDNDDGPATELLPLLLPLEEPTEGMQLTAAAARLAHWSLSFLRNWRRTRRERSPGSALVLRQLSTARWISPRFLRIVGLIHDRHHPMALHSVSYWRRLPLYSEMGTHARG